VRRDLAAHARILASTPPERVRTVPAKPQVDRSPLSRRDANAPHRNRPKLPIRTGGRTYPSFRAARTALGIGAGTLYRWLDSGRARYVA
jgi:hypothetical protein